MDKHNHPAPSADTVADCCAQPGLLPLEAALAQMLEAVTPLEETETVPLLDALDRVIACNLVSPLAVPGHDNSAMDGYALRSADATLNQPLRIIGQALAGHPFNGHLGAGECLRIMTGAPLPAGADAVIMQEQTQRQGEELQLLSQPRAGDHIRRAGDDIGRGQTVFERGRRLGPVDIGLLASLGLDQVQVYRRLRVALLSTGDELQAPGQPLAAGQIYDSNRYTLLALLSRLQVERIDLGRTADDPAALEQAFTQAMRQADVVISSGGVSVGDADFTLPVLERLGQIHFWKLAIKPGKPFAFGRLGQGWFFGLPGNPVSSAITYHQLVVPTLRRLAGETPAPALQISAQTKTNFKKKPGRVDFQRGQFSGQQGNNQVKGIINQSSGALSSLTQANCYVKLEQARGSVQVGETVTVIPFDRFLT